SAADAVRAGPRGLQHAADGRLRLRASGANRRGPSRTAHAHRVDEQRSSERRSRKAGSRGGGERVPVEAGEGGALARDGPSPSRQRYGVARIMSFDEVIKTFIAESQEDLESLERGLVALEGRPIDHELLAQVFRAMHTLKGNADSLGYPGLAQL